MATAIKPYFVFFQTDRVPGVVDHSQPQPGPAGGNADRAGHTRYSVRAGRTVFVWDDNPVQPDGLVPFFARSINVYFLLKDFTVAISSDYMVGSCAYRATRRHEFEAHVYSPIRLFRGYRDVLVRRLNQVPVPTETQPEPLLPERIESFQEATEQRVMAVVRDVRRSLIRDLNADSRKHDSPASYRSVYRQCTLEEWSGRRR